MWAGLVLFYMLMQLIASTAHAAPPPGTDLHSPVHQWFERQYSVTGKWCCNVADGHILNEDEWRSSRGVYEVKINNVWYEISADALRDAQKGGPNPTSKAVVWYVLLDDKPNIFCFAPGMEF